MIKRYDGNSGRMIYIDEQSDYVSARAQSCPGSSQSTALCKSQSSRSAGNSSAGLLTRFLTGRLEALEAEDVILLLILYLMYRESGDNELLIIMGAMCLL